MNINIFAQNIIKTLAYHANNLQRSVRGITFEFSKITIQRPVFVIGCSRAGTTLVYKTFSLASELGTLQKETHDFWDSLHPIANRNWSSHALGAEDAIDEDRYTVSKYFYSNTGKKRFADKNNQNGLSVEYLYHLFNDAIFVYVKRSPGDNIHSLIEGWGKPDEFATWSKELPVSVDIDDGKYTRWCFFLPEGWKEYTHSRIEDVCAFQYASMNQAILDARETIPDSQWVELFYEDILRNPVSSFRDAFESAGLEFGEEVESHCMNVLLRPYNAFSEIKKDKWKGSHNMKRIERIMPLLEDIANKMGYG